VSIAINLTTYTQHYLHSEVSGSQGGEYEDESLLGIGPYSLVELSDMTAASIVRAMSHRPDDGGSNI
jgi:hypothetical protein